MLTENHIVAGLTVAILGVYLGMIVWLAGALGDTLAGV